MSAADHPGQEPQSAGAVLMVRPASFGCNPQTAPSNAFQADRAGGPENDHQRDALQEFHHLANALERAGVEVLIAPDSAVPPKPDAIFPNNWVSFHYDGTVALYPMLAPNRRWERRDEVLEQVVRTGGFRVTRTVDLTHRESEEKYLEGTGSVVLDRAHRVAYACSSPRTDLDVLGEFAQQLDYDLMTFDAVDAGGRAVYHTNVLMAIGTGFAVVCGETIRNEAHRAAVLSKLRATGHEVVDITLPQMLHFAANVLELTSPGGRLVALSTTALSSLSQPQRRILESHAGLIPVEIPTIERVGGGGVRCMLAEIHLPKRDTASARLQS
ncbi:MAG TPA: arginine deiminase-related protein [Steroidobacteraceae bacterium]|nr:arginine deiminase-related protein [Steroidobacteraceae bacterium]